jgi:hypothetical protein
MEVKGIDGLHLAVKDDGMLYWRELQAERIGRVREIFKIPGEER